MIARRIELNVCVYVHVYVYVSASNLTCTVLLLQIADLKNVGGKGGGTITAALFLKEFVEVSETEQHGLEA